MQYNNTLMSKPLDTLVAENAIQLLPTIARYLPPYTRAVIFYVIKRPNPKFSNEFLIDYINSIDGNLLYSETFTVKCFRLLTSQERFLYESMHDNEISILMNSTGELYNKYIWYNLYHIPKLQLYQLYCFIEYCIDYKITLTNKNTKIIKMGKFEKVVCYYCKDITHRLTYYASQDDTVWFLKMMTQGWLLVEYCGSKCYTNKPLYPYKLCKKRWYSLLH